MVKNYYKLKLLYYRLRESYNKLQQKNYFKSHQKVITNYESSNFPKLFMVIKNCFNLHDKLSQVLKLLQTTSKIITNYGRYYKFLYY